MELIVRPEAERDLAEASDWYSQHGDRLKARFIARIESVLARIVGKPTLFPHAKGHLRRASVRDFPYSIYFQAVENKIIVFAVLHHNRDLGILYERLN